MRRRPFSLPQKRRERASLQPFRSLFDQAQIGEFRDIDVDRPYGWGDGCCYHPVARATAATAAAVTTAAVVGSVVNSIPPSCSAVNVTGVTYQQCGSTWYQPQFVGTTVNYVVVNPPQ